MLLIAMIFIGCQPPAQPVQKVDVAPAYVDLVTSKVDKTNDLVQEVAKALTVNTKVLGEIRDLVKNPPTSGAVAQSEPPSTQSPVLAPEVPTLYVTSAKWCQPCRQLKRDVENGKLAPFNIVFREDPNWNGTIPAIRWQEADGRWMFLGKVDEKGYYWSTPYGASAIRDLKQYHGVQ